ncbi:hypothetical protein [Treponema sp. C6A8]|uniref:hypothetical protein n=1 Tax=Treponema sp. C6A8 TaxID=1410609 RepID=UPI00047F2DA4|nr:hypothetical protein [Treponema sp. C6A8]
MKEFSKKTSNIIIVLAIAALTLSSILVLFSNQLVDVIYKILSQKVFHREFSIEKWLPSILSFTQIPAFCTVTATVLLFVKLPNKQKIILISSLLAIFTFVILYTVQVSIIKHVNSDLASELLLGKECVLEKSFWPRGWYYSTEIRLINTQFFSALGWLFTDNMATVKTIQSFFTCLCLFWAEWFILTQLEIKQTWLKLLIAILSFFPYSWRAYYVGCGHNYYVPHGIFALIYAGTFIKIFFRQQTIKTERARKIWLAFFYLWAFTSGFTSIRYIMNFVFPFMLAILIIEVKNKDEKAPKITDFKGFWNNNKLVFTSVLAFFVSGFGYVCNNLILRHFFTFSQWNSMNFNHFGDTTIRDILVGLVEMFGYNQGIAALTPGGAINMLVYAALTLFAVYLVLSLKKGLDKASQVTLVFFVCAMLFNIYTYIHIDYIARYFYPILLTIFPCLAIIIEKSKLSDVRKWTLGTIWAGLLITSSYASISNELNTDGNTDKYAAAAFLKDNGYHFGYGTFANSTVFTFLTNGQIEVGNLLKASTKGGRNVVTSKYAWDTWLTPKRYYENDYPGEKVFLIIETEQYDYTPDLRIFHTGKEVFHDDNYIIYEFESHQAFKEGF